MEKEGLKRSLALLKERRVTIDCIVTDRHPQIQKFLRETGINQYYDVWEKGTFCIIVLQFNNKLFLSDLGTPAFYELEKVLSSKRVLKDIAKLSPHHQTSSLESFHSVFLQFAAKNVIYPFLGMLCR